ncbi:MAG: hypothetical protein ACHQLA_07545 [Ignavibacteriales bacterium]
MKTLQQIFTQFNLTPDQIDALSNEAKVVSIDCGMKGNFKELTQESWDLLDDISTAHWESNLSIIEKIKLGFELFEYFPSYYHFLVPFYQKIKENVFNELDKKLIWLKFVTYLTSEKYYADPIGYVLWVELFEDQSTVNETWHGLINSNPSNASILRLLLQSGPVPFQLKEPIYENLISDTSNHQAIFKSLLYSAFDVFGQIDNTKVRVILEKLSIDRECSEYKLLMEKI